MLTGKNLCNPHAFMRHRRLPTNSVTHPGIMALKEGVAWVGCPDPSCKTELAIKKCKPFEYNVQKDLHAKFPSIIPNVYDGVRCFDGFYMYSEYLPDGTIKRHGTPKLVLNTLLALKKIRDKFPSFRHNDLHVDNVLVKGDRAFIYDFEFANWPQRGKNPTLTEDATFKKDFGMFPGNHPMYDVHFFVNSVCADLPAKFKRVALTVFPKEYIGADSPVVKNWRLRSDVKHTNLPTMDQVIAAFSSLVTSNKNMLKKPVPVLFPKLRTLNLSSPAPKKKAATPKKKSVSSPAVKFSLANKRKVSNRKAELLRRGNFNNDVQAELQAIRNITKLKKAGLLTPSPSPVKGTMGAGGGFVAPLRKSNSPSPVLVFTTTPQRRPRINGKLCTSYKKDELMRVMRRMGYRVDKSDTIKQMCSKVAKGKAAAAAGVATTSRPTVNAVVDVRKKTYAKYLKKNLYRLAKNVGLKATLKDKKQDVINRLYGKLNRNVNAVIGGARNKSTLTARQVAETLAKNYGWKDDRHVERLRILKIYANK